MKKVVVIVVAVATAAAALFFVNGKESAADLNATAANIKAGNAMIACADSSWLMDEFIIMIDETLKVTEKYEKPFADNGTEMTQEAINAMRIEMENNPTPAQLELKKWHEDIIVYLLELYKNDEAKISSVQDAIGRDYVEIYQGAMAVKLELISEDEARKTLNEKYCE
jgi:hypothetical protein